MTIHQDEYIIIISSNFWPWHIWIHMAHMKLYQIVSDTTWYHITCSNPDMLVHPNYYIPLVVGIYIYISPFSPWYPRYKIPILKICVNLRSFHYIIAVSQPSIFMMICWLSQVFVGWMIWFTPSHQNLWCHQTWLENHPASSSMISPYSTKRPFLVVRSHDFPMIFPWFSHDFPMDFPMISHVRWQKSRRGQGIQGIQGTQPLHPGLVAQRPSRRCWHLGTAISLGCSGQCNQQKCA